MSSRSCLIINPCSKAKMEKYPKFQPSNLECADSFLVSLGVTQISKFDKDIHIKGYRTCKTDQNEWIQENVYINAASLEPKPLLPSKDHRIAMISVMLHTLANTIIKLILMFIFQFLNILVTKILVMKHVSKYSD